MKMSHNMTGQQHTTEFFNLNITEHNMKQIVPN